GRALSTSRFAFSDLSCQIAAVIARGVATKQSRLSQLQSSGLLRFARNDDKTHARSLAAGFARVMPDACPSKNAKAQGRPDARFTRSLACSKTSTQVSHYRYAGSRRPSLRGWC